ncbi:uncharacterized protein G2W53_020763 [Senna tora]|uniref:Uncharacterized protein n=1 Tax=Senna tora TaxID=362788 RepID=A0A834WMU2_9FABA|nr:uncharacterized protein G2W53_020763 [Senna tora]
MGHRHRKKKVEEIGLSFHHHRSRGSVGGATTVWPPDDARKHAGLRFFFVLCFLLSVLADRSTNLLPFCAILVSYFHGYVAVTIHLSIGD